MSRISRSTGVPSPVKIYMQFQADQEKGYFSYWDGEKEVSLDELEFIVLDSRNSISGFSKSLNARIYSNLCASVKDKFTVKCGKDVIFTGNYSDNKEKIKGLGGKFQQNVFCLVNLDGELKAANLQLSGSSLGAWMEFVEESGNNKIYDNKIVAKRSNDLKVNGRVKFYQPVFETTTLDSSDASIADEFTRDVLNPWLTSLEVKTENLQEA